MSEISTLDYATASAEQQAAYRLEEQLRGRPSNMKRTLLHSVPAYRAYMEWYALWEPVKSILGLRAATIYAHAISTESNCLLCSTYFRKALADLGLSPETFELLPEEELVVQLGYAAARHTRLDPALWTLLKQRYSEAALVNLVAFAGLMVATNVFNTLVQVDVDDLLTPYLPRTKISGDAAG